MASRGLRRAFVRAKDAVEDWYVAARADLAPVHQQTLYQFAHADDLARFMVTTDTVLGGKSSASLALRRYKHFSAAVFSGVIDYAKAGEAADVPSRGGFAAVRSRPEERSRDLAGFTAVEMRIKSDGRPYIFNVKCADFSAEHLWQMRMVTPPSTWATVAIPFHELMMTRRGRVEMDQQEISRDAISGIGILLADGADGPFKLEVQYIRAIRDFDPQNYVSAAQQALLDAGERKLTAAHAGGADATQNASGDAERMAVGQSVKERRGAFTDATGQDARANEREALLAELQRQREAGRLR